MSRIVESILLAIESNAQSSGRSFLSSSCQCPRVGASSVQYVMLTVVTSVANQLILNRGGEETVHYRPLQNIQDLYQIKTVISMHVSPLTKLR